MSGSANNRSQSRGSVVPPPPKFRQLVSTASLPILVRPPEDTSTEKSTRFARENEGESVPPLPEGERTRTPEREEEQKEEEVETYSPSPAEPNDDDETPDDQKKDSSIYYHQTEPQPKKNQSGLKNGGTSPSPYKPSTLVIRKPKVGAFKVSQPRHVEMETSERIFLKKKDKSNPEWWQDLAPKMTAYQPLTNPLPPNTTRRINNKSDEDNIWVHLYETGQDSEKRKLFQASPESFVVMSKMWEGGFKTHGVENRREVTVPGMTQTIAWDKSLRTDNGTVNPPKKPARRGRSQQGRTQEQNSSSSHRGGGGRAASAQRASPAAEEDDDPLGSRATIGSTVGGSSRASRKAPSHDPAQPNRSPWYQKKDQVMRTMSSKYLLSSSRHLKEDAANESNNGDGGSSALGGGSAAGKSSARLKTRPVESSGSSSGAAAAADSTEDSTTANNESSAADDQDPNRGSGNEKTVVVVG